MHLQRRSGRDGLPQYMPILSSSEEETEEITLMARCAERQLAESIPIPVPSDKAGAAREGTPRPEQTSDQRFLTSPGQMTLSNVTRNGRDVGRYVFIDAMGSVAGCRLRWQSLLNILYQLNGNDPSRN